MVFTYPYFLFALVLAGIPLILHLINKKQIRILKFSSLLFIKKSLQKESRKIRIKELLLLILRTLIIIFLILSCARPVIYSGGKGAVVAGSSGQKSIVLILDNSYSMGLISGGESLFQRSKRIALEILERLMKENDNISLILSGDVNRVKFYDLTYDKKSVIQYIKDSQISLINNNLMESLLEAKNILDRSRNSSRMIYLITDMQKINFMRDESYIYPYIKLDYPLFIIKNSAEDKKNSALINTQIPMKLNFKSDTVSFYPLVKNYSSVKNNLIIKTYINEKAVNQKSLTLEKGEKRAVDIRHMISTGGYLSGVSEIADGDDLIHDNKNYFVLTVPEKVAIGTRKDQKDIFYILNAINPLYILNKTKSGYIHINEYPGLPSNKNDDILLLAYESISTAELKSIRDFLKTGNMLIFPSKKFDINNFNSVFAKSGLTEGLILQKNENKETPFMIEFVDYAHPVFDIFKDIKIFKNTKVYSYLKLKMDNLSINTRILARFSNGDPAVIEYQTATGIQENESRIILFTFLPDKESTDFVFNPNFPPLMHQTIKYLVNRSEDDYINKIQTGQSLDDLFSLLNVQSASVEPVSGRGEEFLEDNIIIKPGVYKLKEKYFAVNVDYAESDMEVLPVSDIVENYKGLSVLSAEGRNEIEENLFHSVYAKGLWKLFLFLAFLSLIAEVIIANDVYKFFIPFLKKYRAYIIKR
ncbi:MAG: BatA and WFA domain-containing protein [Spirochaetes bacterium]|nr:BatA and WFA domain-containing protein [Spirochaetota bacterium]